MMNDSAESETVAPRSRKVRYSNAGITSGDFFAPLQQILTGSHLFALY